MRRMERVERAARKCIVWLRVVRVWGFGVSVRRFWKRTGMRIYSAGVLIELKLF